MGIELITGMGGTNHVDSEDVGALNAELIGNGNYLLSGCEVTMTDANTCHVAAGELLLQGRHVRIKGAGEDVSIGNGQAGYNQRYLICLVYSKATSGIETVELQAFAGAKTTGTATDPAVAVGSILGGDTNVVVPLARLELTGLSVGTPAVMLDSVKGLVALGAETKKIGDSVSSICSKNFTVSQSSTPYGATLEKVIDISMEGYKPLGIVGFTSNHNGSFPFTECCFIDDAHARVAFMNLVTNHNAWGYSEATITVLYIKQ